MTVCLSALLLVYEGEAERAVALLALAFNHEEGVTGWMKQWRLLDQVLSMLENELGAETYRVAWEHGKTLDLDTVVEELRTASLNN